MRWNWLRRTAELFADPRTSRRAPTRKARLGVLQLEPRLAPSTAPLLHISDSGRYFVNPDNQPFFLVGDAPQALPMKLTDDQASTYFQMRAAQGYNIVWMDANWQFGSSIGPNDAYGNPPFDAYLPATNIFDVSTPGEAYWQNIDTLINMASQYGIEVLLNVYDNYSPWFTTGTSPNPPDKLTAYGQFLGKRYADFDNIVWMIANDYSENAGGDASMTAVIRGIRQYDTRHLGFGMDEYGATFDNRGLRSDLMLNSIYYYSSGPWHSRYLSQYNRSDFGPTFNIESGYEFNGGLGMTEALFRNEHYSFLLDGASGDMSGVEGIWDFRSNWQTLMTSEGAREMTYYADLINSIPWYNLTPDQDGTVFQGVGILADYSGAYTADGTLGLAYKPSTGTGSQAFTVNLGAFSAPVTAQWYDPTDGTYIDIGTFDNSGTYTFNSPSTNSAGQNDFVLLLTATAAPGPSAPASLTATPDSVQVLLSRAASSRATNDDIHYLTNSSTQVHTPIKTGITSTAFTDAGLSNTTKDSYQVTAINSARQSGKSSEMSAEISIDEISILPDDNSGNYNSPDWML
jgi:hypothetical protein